MLNLPMPVQKEVHQLGPYAYKTRKIKKFGFNTDKSDKKGHLRMLDHGLRTPGEEIAVTARPKIKYQSQIFRYGQSIFCLPHRPNFSDVFALCLYWVSDRLRTDHTSNFILNYCCYKLNKLTFSTKNGRI